MSNLQVPYSWTPSKLLMFISTTPSNTMRTRTRWWAIINLEEYWPSQRRNRQARKLCQIPFTICISLHDINQECESPTSRSSTNIRSDYMLTQSDETKSGTKQNEMGDVRTVSLLFVLGKRKTPIHDTFSSQDFDHQTEHHNNHRNPKRAI